MVITSDITTMYDGSYCCLLAAAVIVTPPI